MHFKYLYESYNIKHKPTKIKNPQAMTNAPVEELISHWNVLKTGYEEVGCVAVKITKLSILCEDSICSM